MTALIAEKIRVHDGGFFKKFTTARESVEKFLILNKSLLGIVLQNLSKTRRVPRMKELFIFLVTEGIAGQAVSAEKAVSQLGLRGRIVDVTAAVESVQFSDETKSMLYIREAIATALHCPLCKGLLDPNKSVSYDHITPVREGGLGEPENGQLVHPYCNTAYKDYQAKQDAG